MNCRTQGWNALMTASTFGHADVVVTLLRHPHVAPLIDQRDRDGQTALFKACYGG
jgi:ankyrin repeat protein